MHGIDIKHLISPVAETNNCGWLYLDFQGYEPEQSVIQEAQRLSREVRSSAGVIVILKKSSW